MMSHLVLSPAVELRGVVAVDFGLGRTMQVTIVDGSVAETTDVRNVCKRVKDRVMVKGAQ
jgi:hypothetical protein